MDELKRIDRKLVHKGRVIDFYQDTMLLPNGNTVEWDLIDHVGAACVVAVREDGKLLMVRQYRNPLERLTLEVPAGKLNSKDEDPAVCAERELAEETGADIFIGVSAAGLVTKEMVASMADKAIVMAMANPTPEIMPEDALEAGAAVVCTGRSDYPNQVNNVLAFPGIFRGAFDVRAKEINEEMKLAAAKAIASLVSGDELKEDYILPHAFDKRISGAVAEAVADAARKSKVAQI